MALSNPPVVVKGAAIVRFKGKGFPASVGRLLMKGASQTAC